MDSLAIMVQRKYGTKLDLHEYVEIPEGAETLTIIISSNEAI